MRHDVIPELKTCEPTFLKTMNENMYRFEKAWNVYHQWVQKNSEEIIEKDANIVKINIDKLKKSSGKKTDQNCGKKRSSRETTSLRHY